MMRVCDEGGVEWREQEEMREGEEREREGRGNWREGYHGERGYFILYCFVLEKLGGYNAVKPLYSRYPWNSSKCPN